MKYFVFLILFIPFISFGATVNLYPVGAGSLTNISSQTPSSTFHWDKVDDISADDGTTTIQHNTDDTSAVDLYELSDFPFSSVDINSVRLYIRGEGTLAWFSSVLKASSTYYSSEFTTSGDDVFETKSTLYSTNPDTFTPWSISDLNALEIGIESFRSASQQGRVTQVYLEVDYSSSTPPVELATSTLNYQDWIFAETVQTFLLSFIGIGILFSVFRAKR